VPARQAISGQARSRTYAVLANARALRSWAHRNDQIRLGLCQTLHRFVTGSAQPVQLNRSARGEFRHEQRRVWTHRGADEHDGDATRVTPRLRFGENADVSQWGRVAEDGTVFVRTSTGERAVGSWHAGDPASGLEHFARRFDALVTEVELLEQRTRARTGDARAMLRSATKLKQSLDTVNAVGDLDGLARRIDNLSAAIQARIDAELSARAEARTQAQQTKQRWAEEAEQLAESSQWKSAGDRLKEIADQWRTVSALDRHTDDELWKRVRSARTTFERRRGAHFALLDQQRKEAAARKEALVAEAEQLAESSDWQATANRLKQLMQEWKEAGRAQRDSEEALWKRFRAAQDAFFGRRSAVFAEREAGLRNNLAVKEALLEEAAALDPVRDLEGARRSMRTIHERWDKAGRVPRESMAALDARLRAAEDRIRAAAESSAPRPRPDSNPLVARLRESVAKLERQLESARTAGRSDDVARIEESLSTQRSWLTQAESVLDR
jgi:Domain of Unknown Function (DUF349)